MPMRVVSSELDPHKKDSDVSGEHTVFYPTSDAEVKEALTVAKVLGARKVLVRNDRHAANNQPVDGTDAMVVNLRKHCGIEIDSNNNVTVCAGATTSDLAAKLKAHKLFLPLDGNPDKSVVSNVRSTERGFVPAFSLGAFLTGTQGINKENMELVENVQVEGSGAQEEHIVTKMVFKAKTAHDVKDYRMTRLSFTYTPAFFGDVIRHVFTGDNKVVVDDEVDVRVTVFTGIYGMPLFSVTAVGPNDSGYITAMLKRLDPTGDLIVDESTKSGGSRPRRNSPAGREKVFMTTNIREGANIVEAVAKEGKGNQYRYEDHRTRYSGELTEDKLAAYLDAVHRAVGLNPTPILPDVKLFSTASWKAQSGIGIVGVSMSLYAPLPKKQTSAEKQLHRDFAAAINDRSRVDVARHVDPGRQVAVGKLVGLDVGRNVDEPIPNFQGDVYYRDSVGYAEKNECYATSSYPDETERMMPNLIGYPVDAEDVIHFVEHAINVGKKVVVRSGGHQYCGLSSGGDDTMLLSMDLLSGTPVIDAPLDNGKVMAHVGPGVQLADMADAFLAEGVTIPHGECILVCIGGHVQTGGFGHLLRSYGLALDHVQSFDIVLAHSPVELRTITRPTSEVQDGTSSSDDRIFWGVMGGGAGSFGVITNIVFECINDTDHPDSRGYQAVYGYDKAVFRAAMDVVKSRSEDVFNPEVLPDDCDLMVSVLSANDSDPYHPAVVAVEMVHGNVNGLGLAVDDTGLVRMNEEIAAIEESKPDGVLGPITRFTPDNYMSLSTMSHRFVRYHGMSEDGREFPYPYVKRLNCTTKALSTDFVKEFVELVDTAMLNDDIRFVYQMGMGGAAYKGNADEGVSSYPHRDMVMNIVFDVFYTEAEGAEATANQLHDEFGKLVETHWREDIRMTWGSFGEIEMKEVHEEYYGSDGLYERLQTLKQEVDPQDIFHTPFNVQLPDSVADGRSADGRAGKRAKRNR